MLENNKKVVTRYLISVGATKSENTQDVYRKALDDFLNFIGNDDILTINNDKMYEYNDYMRYQKQLSASTRQLKMQVVMFLFAHLERTKYIDKNPLIGLELPKKQKTLPSALNNDEIDRLFDYINNIEDDFLRKRDRIMIITFMQTGLRVSELQQVQLQDISNNTLIITGKGNKDRIIGLSDDLIDMMTEFAIENNLFKHIFVTKAGNPMTKRGIQDRVKNLLEKSNIKDKSVHNLRHTAATEMLKMGVDIRQIQSILGHSSITTTELYTEVDTASKVNIANKFKIGGNKNV